MIKKGIYLLVLGCTLLTGCAQNHPVSSQFSSDNSVPEQKNAVIVTSNAKGFGVHFKQEKLILKGQINTESIAKQDGAAVMYQGGAGGMLIGLLFQSAIESSSQSRREKEINEQASQVLVPYLDTISKLDLHEISHKATTSISEHIEDDVILVNTQKSTTPLAHHIHINPIFEMSYSADAIFLNADISINSINNSKEYEKKIVLQSAPIQDKTNWNKQKFLEQKLIQLIQGSIKIAIQDFKNELNRSNSNKTIRFLENNKKRVERGYLISSDCNRVIFESITGVLKSVPNLNTCSHS